MRTALIASLLVASLSNTLPVRAAEPATDKPGDGDWSQQQAAKFPASEKPIHLFDGKDLTGWTGHIDPYWSVADGAIVGKNTKQDAPHASTYLLTDKKFRNFRLVFEGKLVTSETHSGIAFWGKQYQAPKETEKFSYQGHLVMFPSDFGFYDLYRRNMIYKDKDGAAKKAGRQHDWNQIEILAIGSRIRLAVNGKAVADWTDNKPELCQEGPLGLQLHSNNQAQEVHFRGLILAENPEDRLITATK